MKRISLTFLFMFLVGPIHAQSASDLCEEADVAYSHDRFEKAADLYARAMTAGFTTLEVAYHAAASYARAGHTAEAFAFLDKTVAMGYADPNQVGGDSDFLSLHADPRWQQVLKALEGNHQKYQEQEAKLWDSPSIATPSKPRLTDEEKIAGLSKFWSEVKYNFVFPERLVDLDWDKLYVDYLPKIRSATSTYDYYRILQELCARLRDSHTNIYPPFELVGSVGLHTRLIEDKVMVIEVWDPELRSQGIVPGMEVVEVNGKPARQYAEQSVAPYQSASTRQDLDVRVFEYFFLAGPIDESVQLTLRDEKDRRITRALRRKPSGAFIVPKTPGLEFRLLSGNIGYVALNSFSENSVADDFVAAFDKISKTDGLVLDVRNNGGGNSGVGLRILATLIDKPALMASWQTRDYRPIDRAWGQPIGMLSLPGGDIAPDEKLHYTKPVIVLTSPRTFSAAEDFLVAFDQSGRGTIVGEPSAGSTGQPLSFKMPGGGSGRVGTWRGTYPDGKEFLGIGVRPQRLVVPTVRDFRAGKDAALDAAIAELLRTPATR
jgi:C-terminal processing protease CtpA/Prc